MLERILFLTGKLAEKSLRKILADMTPVDFSYHVHDIGISVAGLMTAEMIQRRLKSIYDADRILVPGRCRGDLEALSTHLGIPVQRGPDELKDLPGFFGRPDQADDLSQYDVTIVAEIVDAPQLAVDEIVERGRGFQSDGADVIDLGCLPDTPFPHLEQSIRALKDAGFRVSVDSLDPDHLLRGGDAGADMLLSLNEDSLWIAERVDSTPVVIPTSSDDPESLTRAIERLRGMGRNFIADPVLDPIHFGFTDSIVRYHALRAQYPDVEIMMGIGNLTELTEADTTGITALLMGIISELRIRNVLVTQVSPHCICAIREADLARRIMFRAREQNSLPKQIDGGLATTHERKPFPYTSHEVRELAEAIRDPSYRIQVTADGIHLFNRDGLHTATDPYGLFPNISVAHDTGHAFYLGVELARAQLAFQLGKRYVQDEELNWGCAVKSKRSDDKGWDAPGPTLAAHAKHRAKV